MAIADTKCKMVFILKLITKKKHLIILIVIKFPTEAGNIAIELQNISRYYHTSFQGNLMNFYPNPILEISSLLEI